MGPLPSSSVLAWVGYARAVLADIEQGEAGLDTPLDCELLDAFHGYLDEWERIATKGPVFSWKTSLEAEMAEYLLHGFHRVVERLAKEAEARGASLTPPDAEAFYVALVQALLDGLTEEGPVGAEFAGYLRSFWPGLPVDR